MIKSRLFVVGNFQLDQAPTKKKKKKLTAKKSLLQKKPSDQGKKKKPYPNSTPTKPLCIQQEYCIHTPSLLRGVPVEGVIICVWLRISLCSEHLPTCNVCIKMHGVERKALHNNIYWLTQINNWP